MEWVMYGFNIGLLLRIIVTLIFLLSILIGIVLAVGSLVFITRVFKYITTEAPGVGLIVALVLLLLAVRKETAAMSCYAFGMWIMALIGSISIGKDDPPRTGGAGFSYLMFAFLYITLYYLLIKEILKLIGINI